MKQRRGTFPVDGLWMDAKSNLYLSGLRQGAILKRTPDGKIKTVVADPRIQWPDTFAEGPDGAIYFTCSHIHHMARFNGGKEGRTEPYRVFKFMPPQGGTVAKRAAAVTFGRWITS